MTTSNPSSSRTPLTPRRIGAIALAVVAVVFFLQNRDPVSLQVFFIDISAPLWLAFLATLALGGLIGWLLCGRRRTGR